MMEYNKINIEKERIYTGFACSFCDRIFDDFDLVNQVVVVRHLRANSHSGMKLAWICHVCSGQGRTVTKDGKTIFRFPDDMSRESVEKEMGERVYNDYRKSVWKGSHTSTRKR